MTAAENGAGEVLRAFIAAEINENVRQALEKSQKDLRQTPARVSWVSPPNIHITLVFLGNIFRSHVDDLGRRMDTITDGVMPFEYEAVGLGFFGSARSPRVIWAGIRDPSSTLVPLQAEIARAVGDLGIKTEERAFTAHLTLGWVRSSRKADTLTSPIESANNTSYGWVKVERVLLMQSHLEHQGVRYSILHESLLKGASHHG